jgi:hypothetical protein
VWREGQSRKLQPCLLTSRVREIKWSHCSVSSLGPGCPGLEISPDSPSPSRCGARRYGATWRENQLHAISSHGRSEPLHDCSFLFSSLPIRSLQASLEHCRRLHGCLFISYEIQAAPSSKQLAILRILDRFPSLPAPVARYED